jgi:hypothetical protein
MKPPTLTGNGGVGAARWAARLLGGCLALLWGAFLVEHLEWFADPRQLPPAWVTLTVGLHALMVLGLLLAWRWERLGAVLALGTAVPFFWVAAGRNFVPFVLVTALPPVLWLYCDWHDRRARGAGAGV